MVLGLVLLYQLMCPPCVGMNDNGDFWRIMKSYGLQYPAGYHDDAVTWNRSYDWDGRLLRPKMFPSSELLPAGIALALSALIAKDGSFDIVLLGLVLGLFYVLGFALIVKATCHWRMGFRIVLCALLLLVFGDVGYVSYFNSFYTESATLIFSIILMGSLALLLLRDLSPRAALWVLGLYFASSLLFVTGKLQNLPMGFILVGLGFYLSRRLPVGDKLLSRRVRRLGTWLSLALLLFTMAFWGSYKFVPGMRTNNVYNMVFNEILRTSKQPRQDLAQLGLDSSYMKYYGTFAWTPGINEQLRQEVFQRVGNRGILRFYIRNPERYLDLVRRAAKSVFVMRVPYLGNFPQGAVSTSGVDFVQIDHDIRECNNLGSGYPYALPARFRSQAFGVWSGFKDRFVPKSVTFLVFALLINAACIVVKRVRFDKLPRQRAITAVHASLLFGRFLQFFVVVLAEGERDIVKHFFLFNLLCDFCFGFLIAYAVFLLSCLCECRPKQS